MRLSTSDPDISTLYRKICDPNRLDLQPNFQRGEVWSKLKKQRLIDSILRNWYIPPIHVIQAPGVDKQEVLDGQQRLVSIRDFMNGDFPINGLQEPLDNSLKSLHGLYWNEVPKDIQSKFLDYAIRVITIIEYKTGEPGELFFRLNQPTNLTSAEQRNAFYGEARQQVKTISEFMEQLGYSSDTMGFSNSRMAYDDIISKILMFQEIGKLTQKITAAVLTNRYRETTGFSIENERDVKKCLEILLECIKKRKTQTKLNKATLNSWLIFVYRALPIPEIIDACPEFFDKFESLREKEGVLEDASDIPKGLTRNFFAAILLMYQDKASSRIADVSSVVSRDLILWLCFSVFEENCLDKSDKLKELSSYAHYLSSNFINESINDQALSMIVKKMGWGEDLCL